MPNDNFSINSVAISLAQTIAKDKDKTEILQIVQFLEVLQQALRTYTT